jgi:hypothetical protein
MMPTGSLPIRNADIADSGVWIMRNCAGVWLRTFTEAYGRTSPTSMRRLNGLGRSANAMSETISEVTFGAMTLQTEFDTLETSHR